MGMVKQANIRNREIEAMLEAVLESRLSDTAQEFIESLSEWFDKHQDLTEKQYSALCSFYERLDD